MNKVFIEFQVNIDGIEIRFQVPPNTRYVTAKQAANSFISMLEDMEKQALEQNQEKNEEPPLQDKEGE